MNGVLGFIRRPAAIALLAWAWRVANALWDILRDWPTYRGYEPTVVAQSIATGFGFSGIGAGQSIFRYGPPGIHFPTAWVDPIYSYLLAGCMYFFGRHAYLVAALLNVCFMTAALFFTYQATVRVTTPKVAATAIVILCLYPAFAGVVFTFTNATMGAALVAASMWRTIRYFQHRDLRSAAILGMVLGITALGCPSTMLFLPAAMVAMLTAGWGEWRKLAVQLIAMTVCAVAVIAPWSIRNALTFGEFVPVRTGSGQIVYASTVALAETFQSGISESGIPLDLRTEGPADAVRKNSNAEVRRALQAYQLEVVAKAYPSATGYAEINEAQRDAFFSRKTHDFVVKHPGIAMQLAYFKLLRFVTIGATAGLLLVLAAAASFIGLCKSNIHVRALGLLSLAYAAPFSIIVIYFSRYRMPIEPIFVVMACIGLADLISRVTGTVSDDRQQSSA